MYQMISGEYCIEGQSYTGYGIRCGDIELEDITCEKTEMEKFIKILNEEKLETVYLMDIIEDFLG